jgi:hypothetical protein
MIVRVLIIPHRMAQCLLINTFPERGNYPVVPLMKITTASFRLSVVMSLPYQMFVIQTVFRIEELKGIVPRRAFLRRVCEGCQHGRWGLLLAGDGYLVSRVLQAIYSI